MVVVFDLLVGLLLVITMTTEALFAGPFERSWFAAVAVEAVGFGVRAFEWPGVIESVRVPGGVEVTSAAGRGPHARVRRV